MSSSTCLQFQIKTTWPSGELITLFTSLANKNLLSDQNNATQQESTRCLLQVLDACLFQRESNEWFFLGLSQTGCQEVIQWFEQSVLEQRCITKPWIKTRRMSSIVLEGNMTIIKEYRLEMKVDCWQAV